MVDKFYFISNSHYILELYSKSLIYTTVEVVFRIFSLTEEVILMVFLQNLIKIKVKKAFFWIQMI